MRENVNENKIPEKRGRFIVQELDEEEIKKKCRHYSIFNRTIIHHYLINNEQNSISSPSYKQFFHSPYFLDVNTKTFTKFGILWNDFKKNLKREMTDLDIIFDFDIVDRDIHKEDTDDDSPNPNYNFLSSYPYEHEILGQEYSASKGGNKNEINEYNELGHSTIFIMNAVDFDTYEEHANINLVVDIPVKKINNNDSFT